MATHLSTLGPKGEYSHIFGIPLRKNVAYKVDIFIPILQLR